MRILLAHNSLYYPSHGGGDKSNRLLMEALAARGHAVRVVARVERFGAEDHAKLARGLEARRVQFETTGEGVVCFALHDVDVRTVALQSNLRPYFAGQIAEFSPDAILTSTDDPGQLLFDIAVQKARVVHLVRATIAVPFGPDSSAPNAAKTELLKRADRIVGVSNYVAGYVREHGGMDAVHVPISLLEPVAEYPVLGRFDSPYVTFANPCAVKGIAIFLELAIRMPHVQFAAVPTWGTTAEDMDGLRARSNVAVLPAVDNIDELLAQTRVLLVPSVWAEARSRIVVEAMSRAVPVIASSAGGLPEAKLGVPYMLPVNLIRHYRPSLDRNMVPVADVPPQDVSPWVEALARLTTDRGHWEEIARRSRDAALEYARNLNVLPFESLLEDVVRAPKKSSPAPPLSDEKRKLLALRLKQKTGSQTFVGTPDASRVTLFCFPHAGGGTLTYLKWRDVLPVVAARLPGRESRLHEPAIDDIQKLVAMLGEAMRGQSGRFAFFGHSMGAGVAFELTRWLRRNGLALPERLIVSAARAPQWREHLAPPPDPSDEELLAAVPEMPQDPELLKLALPALRADTRLYRRWVFTPEEPLPVPITAFAGDADPNLSPADVEGWAELTSAGFQKRVFPGGHFFLWSPGFVEAVAEELR